MRVRGSWLGVAIAIVLAGCSPAKTPAPRSTATSNSSGTAASSLHPSADSASAANSTGITLVPVTSSEVMTRIRASRARVTIVNAWATWCAPCREEFPELLAAARAARNRGVELILVSTDFDDQRPQARRFLAEHGVSGESYIKHEGDLAFIDGLDPSWSGALPATFVFGPGGKRVEFWEGRADRARFERAIENAIRAEHPPSGGTP